MPVSHGHACVFVHIPKTAGSSIEHALGMHGSIETIGLEPYLDQRKNEETLFGAGAQHYTAAQIEQAVGSATFASYFKFSFVRNPWDRMVSAASWAATRSGQPNWHRGIELDRDAFDATVEQQLALRADGRELDLHFREQSPFLWDADGRALVDYVGRFETLDTDWRAVCTALGIDVPLERRMRSRHGCYRDYYSAESRRRVGELYAEDCERFGYEF